MPLGFGLNQVRNPVLLETGTWQGGVVAEALRAGFERVISIELVPEIFQANLPKFERQIKLGRVHLLQGNSADVMPEAMRLTEGLPTTFWLDAHCYRGHGAGITNPLFAELDAIAAMPNEGHIVMIDDRHMFEEWGIDEEKLRARLLEIHPGCVLSHGRGARRDRILIARIGQPPVLTSRKPYERRDLSSRAVRAAISAERRGKRRGPLPS